MLTRLLAPFVLALVLALIGGWPAILGLRRLKAGQVVSTDAPQRHQAKSGTPTMGGLIILAAALLAAVALAPLNPRLLAVIALTLTNTAIGFLDDYLIVRRGKSLGLKARQKLFGQFVLAIAFVYWFHSSAPFPGPANGPQASGLITLAWQAFQVLLIVGVSNAVNLTDGLDGLAAGSTAIVLLAYIAITFISGLTSLALAAGCLVGACVGFLWFNSFPASIFMGDTGSLGLGGAVAAMAVMTRTELLLIILGGIFVVEALSVVIQVLWFQTRGKRVFLMAPIHHHFELQAWSETKIILRFWIVAAVCAAIGFTVYQQSIT
jgi:phospho-N-acetylmuramoyl-pentapeptide-transferase